VSRVTTIRKKKKEKRKKKKCIVTEDFNGLTLLEHAVPFRSTIELFEEL
jgi:hypothetical protein